MAIKKLQHGFTNYEQSKRLLELCVPADSADMYYKHTMLAPYLFSDGVSFSVYSKVEDIIPCWSVGRLIEIYELCSGKKYERKPTRLVREGNVDVMKELTIIEDIIGDITNARLYIYPHMDFSKLEE